MKKQFLFLFYLLSGIILGSLLANLCNQIPALWWLGYSNTLGVSAANPMIIDLIIIKVTFGFAMSVSVAQIITVSIAMWLYRRAR